MTTSHWRARAGSLFTPEKRPALGSRGMVVANHPLAAAAGIEMLAVGGNAVDAAIATLFTLTVVEPMMVGLLGGGVAHLRLADGTHHVVDGFSTAPAAARADMYRPTTGLETEGRQNQIGALAVCAPGTLLAWAETLAKYGTMPLADVMAPAIRRAEEGFAVTPYLAECIAEAAPDFRRDPAMASHFLPGDTPLAAGTRLRNPAYAATLRSIAAEGAGALHGGALGGIVADHLARLGGILTAADIAAFRPIERQPVRGAYRDVEVVGPPPPTSGGVHVLQMLNILEGFDLRGLGFGTAASLHLVAEALKIAFADRAEATADPAFVDVPVAHLIDKAYAAERRALIEAGRAQAWTHGVPRGESANTTHVTVADGLGNIVSTTQTINGLFGARIMIPGTGLIPNNYMANFDPTPGRVLSIAPGKRITSSMAPLIVLRDGRPDFALGLPGGLRIFGSAMQAVLNLVDHHMSLQEAVEAPRLFTQGDVVEVEPAIGAEVRGALTGLGHRLLPVPHIGGGMNAIRLLPDGLLMGAACWRADGTAIGLGGGLARPGVRFWPDRPRV
jgi:gamma-glutamyltranspeptidase/glutathione hydrolase